LWLVHIV